MHFICLISFLLLAIREKNLFVYNFKETPISFLSTVSLIACASHAVVVGMEMEVHISSIPLSLAERKASVFQLTNLPTLLRKLPESKCLLSDDSCPCKCVQPV